MNRRASLSLGLVLWLAGLAAAVAVPEKKSPEAAGEASRPAAVKSEAEINRLANARQEKATKLVQEADRLNRLYQLNPTDRQAAETRRLEAKALIEAADAGDTGQKARLAALVQVVRRDATLPEAKRSEIVAMQNYQQAGIGRLKSPDDRFATIERIERGLIAEFPNSPNGYEALYRLALYCDDAKGKALAGEVARMPQAPAWVKDLAGKLLARYALIGTNLKDLLPASAGVSAARPGRKEVVVYAWSSAQPGTVAFAQQLKKLASQETQLIGVCLDRDEAAGRAAAAAAGLAGDQVYDSTGGLAARLRFEPGAIYIADANDLIRTVSGARELARRQTGAPSKR